MSAIESVRSILNTVKSGKSLPALSIVQSNPETAAMISKLVTSREQQHFNKKEAKSFHNLDQGRIEQISHTVKERISDAESMMQLFPDMELAAQILISSILSPKDMVNTEIIYTTNDLVVPSDISMKIMDKIKLEIENVYGMKKRLPDMLREILFECGSYIRAVIPESSVDELINKGIGISTENLTDFFDKDLKTVSYGILGLPTKKEKNQNTQINSFAFESFNVQRAPYQEYKPFLQYSGDVEDNFDNNFGKYIEITDNYSLLKLPKVIETNNKNKIKSIISKKGLRNHSLESRANISEKDLHALLYKGVQPNAMPFVSVKTQDNANRKSIGRPMVMKLPSEAVIPVYVPGDSKRHIGYFVIIDEDGNPVTRRSNENAIGSLQSQLNNQDSSMTSFLLKKARNNLSSAEKSNITLDQAAKIYSDIVESDLIERLRNGIYGSNVEISGHEDVYRIMLARTFTNQYTRLVYIPVELVTYYAYKYYDNGVGKSLLDDLKVINSLRAILLFAKVMAMTKNSIAVTHVNMTIDPEDIDPQKTIEMSINEIIKMRQQYFPLGINSPSDLVDWVQRAGFEFSFEGHPGLPQTKFDFETRNLQHQVPDSDLEELLRKQSIMAVGLSPETVDNGFNSEFATTVVSNNILLSKRVLQIQTQIEPLMSDEAKKICANDFTIRENILEILKDNIDAIEKYISDEDREIKNQNENLFYEMLLERFLETIELKLPKPDITSLETLSQAFDHYQEALDKALDSYLSSEFITSDIAGDLSANIDSIKNVYKAYFLRQWMATNGYFHELNEILASDEDGKSNIDAYDVMKNHIDSLLRGSVKFLKALRPMVKASNSDLSEINLDNSATGESSSDSFSSDTSETDTTNNPDGESSNTPTGEDEDLNLGIGDLDLTT